MRQLLIQLGFWLLDKGNAIISREETKKAEKLKAHYAAKREQARKEHESRGL